MKNKKIKLQLVLCVVLFVMLLPLTGIVCGNPLNKKTNIPESAAWWPWKDHFPDLEGFIQKIDDYGLGIQVELVGIFAKGEDHRTALQMLADKGKMDTCIYPYPMPDAFNYGLNDPNNHIMILESLIEGIDLASDYSLKDITPTVIAFAGKKNGISFKQGVKNCAIAARSKYLKNGPDCKMVLCKDENGKLTPTGEYSIVDYARMRGVVIVFELLNRTVDKEMQGHPGYQGHSKKFCMAVIKEVDSEYFLLLLDIYHWQIEEGNIIESIRELIEFIGHIHTAGVPGRNDIDETQEINYRPIIQELAKLGYKGVITHEFIPKVQATKDKTFHSLVKAVCICNVEKKL
jgi:hydroxypyruvate isomerase